MHVVPRPGGTLNKLEAIPGMRTNLSSSEILSQLSDIGVAVFGATSTIAPVDKKVYRLRDQTGMSLAPGRGALALTPRSAKCNMLVVVV
eukprot:645219-Rhodomonas_salina.2